ncbi:hypothetical protein [Hymenobacter koreensis]|uniref:DUF3098 domain-containing protein n=1 Tax=Hymenobacter koreensis TaxID=1084523 RepID=A0ABP8JJW2_9BACT
MNNTDKQTLKYQLIGTRRNAAIFFGSLALFVGGLIGLAVNGNGVDKVGISFAIGGGVIFLVNLGVTLFSEEKQRQRGE